MHPLFQQTNYEPEAESLCTHTHTHTHSWDWLAFLSSIIFLSLTFTCMVLIISSAVCFILFPFTHFPVMILRTATVPDGVGVGGVNYCLTCLVNVDLKEGVLLPSCPSVLPIIKRFINKCNISCFLVGHQARNLNLHLQREPLWINSGSVLNEFRIGKGCDVLCFLCPDLKNCLSHHWRMKGTTQPFLFFDLFH